MMSGCNDSANQSGNSSTQINQEPMTSIYEIPLKTIEGEETTLAAYKGKKMLIVNVASKCGYTPQYANLQELYNEFGEKVVVIGFPANNFGWQEPGTNEEIQSFCSKNYGVTFPMFEKIDVKGKDQHPLYQWLTDKKLNGWNDKGPNWNFCKYLISEDGKLLKFFPPSVNPVSEEIINLL